MNKLLEFLIHSNIYLAMGAGLVYFPIIITFNLPFRYEIFLIYFLGTFSLYTFNRYSELEEDKVTYKDRTEFIEANWQLKPLAIISFIIVLLLALENVIVLSLILFVSLIMYFYSVGPLRIKNIFLLKNFIIAFSWALILVFLPLIFESKFIFEMSSLAFFTIFMATFINTVIFDIRDIMGDRINKIPTIPVRYGTSLTKKILLTLNTFSAIILIMAYLIYQAPLLLIIPFLYLYIPLFLIGHKDPRIVADILGDAWLIVFGLTGFIVYTILSIHVSEILIRNIFLV